MAKPFLKVKKISELESYFIPDYQRPYKWKKENVFQLLEDFYENAFTKDLQYRVGSLIIHNDAEENKLNIVDGQQRLTTLALIFKFLKVDENFSKNFVFSHEISKNNISYNYQQIENWFRSKNINKESFADKILENCEFAVITVYKQDEAFQLFDSQNSRGKELDPHDLLKAFHLREMEKNEDSEEEMRRYAVKWENYILKDGNPLLQILNNHLFRIRKWAKREPKYYFTKADIREFKGISLHERAGYNFEAASRILQGAIETSRGNGILKNFQIAQDYPFQITMPIINGKNFFDYVFHYIETKENLMKEKSFGSFYTENFKGYYGDNRAGDQKVRNLFKNLSLHFCDRFGIGHFSDDYHKEFYKNAYYLRLDKKSINDRSIINYDASQKLFRDIPNSFAPENLHSQLYQNYPTKKPEDMVKGADKILEKFKTDNDGK